MIWWCSAFRCPSLLVVGDSSPAVDAVVGLSSHQWHMSTYLQDEQVTLMNYSAAA